MVIGDISLKVGAVNGQSKLNAASDDIGAVGLRPSSILLPSQTWVGREVWVGEGLACSDHDLQYGHSNRWSLRVRCNVLGRICTACLPISDSWCWVGMWGG